MATLCATRVRPASTFYALTSIEHPDDQVELAGSKPIFEGQLVGHAWVRRRFVPLKRDRRFVVLETRWQADPWSSLAADRRSSLSAQEYADLWTETPRPASFLDVPTLSGRPVAAIDYSAYRELDRRAALELAASRNRQSCPRLDLATPSTDWAIIVEIGQRMASREEITLDAGGMGTLGFVTEQPIRLVVPTEGEIAEIGLATPRYDVVIEATGKVALQCVGEAEADGFLEQYNSAEFSRNEAGTAKKIVSKR